MLLAFASAALAGAPPLLPLSTDPRVGDQTIRVAALGSGTFDGEAGASATGLVEGAIASRVAIAARIDTQLESEEPQFGADVKVQVTGPNAGADVAVGGRYKREGFVEGANEVEIFAGVGKDLGQWRLTGNVVGGTAIGRDEGDAELLLSAARHLGDHFRLGVDARGRLGFRGEGEEEAEEFEFEAEGEAHAADSTVGAFGAYDAGRFSITALAGGQAAAFRDGDVAVGAIGELGVQVAF